MSKKFVLFLLGLGFVFQVAAQTPGSANHLLWRISGNGLTRPSYLFGTMHLTDKRLFHFSDSLYSALEQTEGFAAELDLNSIFTQYINSVMTEDKEKVFIEDDVDSEWLKKNKAMLEKKFKKPVSKITLDDINSAEQKRNRELLESGEMKTFMDAYLFDIAGRQGKWTGGIEDPEDQLGLKEDISTSDRLESLMEDKSGSNELVEWMIETYLREDLELIDRTDMIWRGARDAILLKRNIKMAMRIDSLSQVRSCLFAVGAAHLPGDTGVVRLLRQKGYTLIPVISSRRIAPEAYKFTEKERLWVDVVMRDSLYALQMPVKPSPFKGIETAAIDMQFHFDLGSYSGYFTLGVPANVPSEAIRDTILARIARNYSDKSESFTAKDITVGDVKGKEIVLKNNYGEYRVQAFVPGDYVALNAVFAIKKNMLFEKDANRFFASFQPAKITKKEQHIAGPPKWQKFDFAADGFSVSLPGKYNSKNEPRTEETGWKRKSYELIDIYSQTYYGITVDATTAGYYSDGDSAFFEMSRENFVDLMKGTIIDSQHTVFEGFPAYRLKLKSEEDDSRIITEMLMVNRGNRRYGLFMAYDSATGGLTSGEQLFKSFTFLPVPKAVWQTTTSPDYNFSCWAPSAFRVKEQEDPEPNTTRYMAYDSAGIVTVLIDKEVFAPYYWANSAEQLLSDRVATFVGVNDSVIRRHDFVSGNASGVDVDIWLAESQNIKKMRLLLSGDTLYTLFTFVPEEIIKQGEYDRLISDFRLTTTTKSDKLFTSKATALINALQNGSEEEFKSAKQVLSSVTFTTNDLPQLQQALLHIYPDSVYDEYSTVNSQLVQQIASIDSTYSSIAFVKASYPLLKTEKSELKPYLLSLLTSFPSKESYDLLVELLVKDPPADDTYYAFYDEMFESDFLDSLFPALLPAMSDPNIGLHIADLANEVFEREEADLKTLKEHKREVINAAKVHLAFKEVEDEPESYVLGLVRLLTLINDPAGNDWLRKVATRTKDATTRLTAVRGLLENKQVVDKSVLLTMARADVSRNDLYLLMKEQKSLKQFPAEFLSQRWLGQSVLYEWVASDEDPPQKIMYVGEKIAVYLGEKKKFHLYKIMQVEGEPETYLLGVAGPYALDAKDLETTHTATQPYINEPFSTTRMNEQFKKFLKKMEGEDK